MALSGVRFPAVSAWPLAMGFVGEIRPGCTKLSFRRLNI